ncbi:hypothetical protein CBM2605_A140150 [Cupriavidus neocaledonicus]|uniref:Uncharacterized protein n=1 Tax=Cupriavidus neocaledonicus TaxID=1040979 RepID=A0ABY1UWZ3_9BURK|nr:hypothetical protein CBM2605_A140150 [Cupriavidus neocaledonicus]
MQNPSTACAARGFVFGAAKRCASLRHAENQQCHLARIPRSRPEAHFSPVSSFVWLSLQPSGPDGLGCLGVRAVTHELVALGDTVMSTYLEWPGIGMDYLQVLPVAVQEFVQSWLCKACRDASNGDCAGSVPRC